MKSLISGLVPQLGARQLMIMPALVCALLCLVKETLGVRVVALHVPRQVRRGAEVELVCLYELGNASLYSLKWFYRANGTELDEQEFFRYTPTLAPHKQYFPLEGLRLDVNKSEGGRVVLSAPSPQATGNYKCEISVEGTFQTVAAEKLMTVLDFWSFYLPTSLLPSAVNGIGPSTAPNQWILLPMLLLSISLFVSSCLSSHLSSKSTWPPFTGV